MDNKKIFALIAGICGLFFLLRLVYFEKKDVSTENWYKNFKYESEDPYGAYVFHELVKQKYGEEKVIRNHLDTLLSNIESDRNLYIFISNEAYINEDKVSEIKSFISKGNQALIISKKHYPILSSGLHEPNYYQFEEEQDSIFKFTFSEYTDTLSYKHYSRSNNRAALFHAPTFSITDSTTTDSSITNLAYEEIENTIFFKSKLDTGEVYRHVFPELFSNIAAQQDFYLDHFNAVFKYLHGDMIIIDHPGFDSSYIERDYESPIQYILGERSLKWAYYVFLFATLCFLFFRGKRKQRIIPIPEKNENTSIQYVDTLSDLFEQQNQNEKLVPHMQAIFFQRVKQKYYLTQDNEKFVALLSKKSRIPENQITAILNYFKTGTQDYSFSDDQLIMLHQRLEDFYNNAE